MSTKQTTSPFSPWTAWAPIIRQTAKTVTSENPNSSKQEIVEKTVAQFNEQGSGCQINQADVRQALKEAK